MLASACLDRRVAVQSFNITSMKRLLCSPPLAWCKRTQSLRLLITLCVACPRPWSPLCLAEQLSCICSEAPGWLHQVTLLDQEHALPLPLLHLHATYHLRYPLNNKVANADYAPVGQMLHWVGWRHRILCYCAICMSHIRSDVSLTTLNELLPSAKR